jgi:hypothetical protein
MPRVIHYEDLALSIRPDGEESYQVHALDTPYGLTVAPFALPFCRRELEMLIEDAAEGVSGCHGSGGLSGARDVNPVPRLRATEQDLQETGARLFRALFHEAVREIYLLSKGRSESTPDRGLRIRLVLPVDTPDSALLQSLPWELLYCEHTDDFLARNVLTPVVRQLVIPWASSSFQSAVGERIRILIVVASPRGSDSLDEAAERARILEAWCRREGVEVEVLLKATLIALRERLRSEHYHVIHFIGHGRFDAEAGAGYLLFETPDRGPHLVSGRLLAEALRESGELRFVFLNACNSGELGYRPTHNPLLGAAAALVRRGVPAVLAMQFPISDEAAKVFSEAVYRSLARGSSMEAAVGDGRFAIHQANPESWEWITPVLFTALSGSQIFQPLCSPTQESTSQWEEAVSTLGGLLAAGSHERARQLIEACLEKGLDSADLHYYRALALLAGRRPGSLKPGEIKAVEASATHAAQCDDYAAHHLCLLAFLYEDFYMDNYLVVPAPGYEELLRRAAASPMQPARLDELSRLVPGAKAVVAFVTEQARSQSR